MSLFKRKQGSLQDHVAQKLVEVKLRETQARTIDNMLRVERIVKAARIVSIRSMGENPS